MAVSHMHDAPRGSCCGSVCFQLFLASQCDSTSHVYLCLSLSLYFAHYILLLITLPCFLNMLCFFFFLPYFLSRFLSTPDCSLHIFSPRFFVCPFSLRIFTPPLTFSPLPPPPRTPPHPPPTSSSHACHLFFHFLTQHLALCMSISGLYLPLPMPASPPPGSHYLSPSLPLSCLCLCLDSFYSRTCPTHMCMCARVHPHSRTPARTLIHSFRGIASLGRSFSLPLETWQTCLLKEDLMSRQDLSRIVSLKHILGISVVRAANMMHNKWIYARFWCFCQL